jgi:hypothetical protein
MVVRNTYTQINLGNAVESLNPNSKNDAQVFIQFLPTTDPVKAHDEFIIPYGGNGFPSLNSKSNNNSEMKGKAKDLMLKLVFLKPLFIEFNA